MFQPAGEDVNIRSMRYQLPGERNPIPLEPPVISTNFRLNCSMEFPV